MDYVNIAKKRMDSLNSKDSLKPLFKSGLSTATVTNYYTSDSHEVVLINDDSDEADSEMVLYSRDGVFVEGDYVTWKGKNWLVLEAEEYTLDNYDKFYIKESIDTIKFIINDEYDSQEHPITFYDLSSNNIDDLKSTVSSIMIQSDDGVLAINKNDETSLLGTGDEVIINGSVWEIDYISDYRYDNILLLKSHLSKASNSDDISNNVANTSDRYTNNKAVDGALTYSIDGSHKIRKGETKIYEPVIVDANGGSPTPGSVNYNISSSKASVVKDGLNAEVTANEELGTFVLVANIDSKVVEFEIEVVSFWG